MCLHHFLSPGKQTWSCCGRLVIKKSLYAVVAVWGHVLTIVKKLCVWSSGKTMMLASFSLLALSPALALSSSPSSLSSCPYTATCVANGIQGVCLSTSNNCCSGQTTSGLCPGSSDIQCCTMNSCSTPHGSGTCLSTSSCTGASYSGYCTGPSDLQCCVTSPDDESIFGKNPYYYSNWCNGASLEYLDDAKCVKKFPSSYDREWSCPVRYNEEDSQLDGYTAANLPLNEVSVDINTLSKIVSPEDANICLIVLKRTTTGKLMNKSAVPASSSPPDFRAPGTTATALTVAIRPTKLGPLRRSSRWPMPLENRERSAPPPASRASPLVCSSLRPNPTMTSSPHSQGTTARQRWAICRRSSPPMTTPWATPPTPSPPISTIWAGEHESMNSSLAPGSIGLPILWEATT
jgi:hypothetical protein